jgi:hypothetical protein
MRFSSIVLFAVGIVAFTIPDGQPNGVYEAYIAADGTEVHELIMDAPGSGSAEGDIAIASATISSAKFAKRDFVGCGGRPLNADDTNKANSMLDAQCGGGASVPGGRDFYSIWGCTVAWACNFAGTTNCFASERNNAALQIIAVCWKNAAWLSGWYRYENSVRNIEYGFGDVCGGERNFCGRGTNGKI